MPLGPNEVRIASPTANIIEKVMISKRGRPYLVDVKPLAAVMFDMRTSMGFPLSWNFELPEPLTCFASTIFCIYIV
jgi:hypothetical protein